MDDMSIVIVFYEVNGCIVGILGVIGLICMVYECVIFIVDIMVKLFFSVLS